MRIIPLSCCLHHPQVIVLQTYWRRWLAGRYVDALRKERHARTEWEREREEERRRGREEREKTEFQRRMNPKTKEDFELLYHALEGEDSLISGSCCRVTIIQFCPSSLSLSPPVWRQEELDRINSTTSGAERKAALCALLEQEAQLIAGIGQHRLVAGRKAQQNSVQRFLDAVSEKLCELLCVCVCVCIHSPSGPRPQLPRGG